MDRDLFPRVVDIILAEEGGIAHHARDPGGLTKFGISQRSYPHLNIAALTRDQAMALYRRDYWQPIQGEALPPGLALLAFDCAINQGVGIAVRLLQASLGVTVDGVLGPVTVQTANRAPPEVLGEFCARRAWRYEISRNEDVFGLGWFRRLFRLYAIAQAWSVAVPISGESRS